MGIETGGMGEAAESGGTAAATPRFIPPAEALALAEQHRRAGRLGEALGGLASAAPNERRER